MALDIKLLRSNDEQSWGFRLIGGTDFEMPLTVIKVQPSSPADAAGLQNGDALTLVSGVPSSQLSHDGAYEVIKTAGLELDLKIFRGRYDAVLDDQEPIYEEIEYDQQMDYFDPQLEDPSEVFRPIGYPTPVPETPTIQVPTNESISRSLTASPFVLPTKPYRPFSTEPVEIPPLEEPIILNPGFHDEFGSFEQDFLPKTRFKLPISEQYDPDFGKEKKIKTKVVDSCNLQQTVKETCLSECYQNDSRIEEFMIKVKEETVLNKREDDVQQSSYSEKYKDEMVQCEVDKIEETASRVVRESIERALSVAEEVKQEMTSENVCKSYETINSQQIIDLVEENKVCVAEKIKEFENVAQKTEEKQDLHESRMEKVSNQANELSTIDVSKIVSVFNDSAKSATEDLETCNQKLLVTKASEAKAVENKSSEVISNVKSVSQSQTANKEYVDTKQTTNTSSSTFSKVKTSQEKSSSKSSAEQRAFVIGLQTIPKIRGNVHSSFHYNLLLKTFFLHLTDVMVALSRFILTEPTYAITDDQINAQRAANERKQSQSIEEQLQVIQNISDTITSAEVESSKNVIREHNVRVRDVVKKEREKDFANVDISNNLVEKLSMQSVESTDNTRKLSGSKMAQLIEHKSDNLTQKMGAVINEFQNKTNIDEKVENIQVKCEEVVIENQTSEESNDFGVEKNNVSEFPKNVVDRQENTATETESVEVTEQVPKKDKHYYVATVESHVYTNKDTILSEQLSDTSSLQSVEATNVVESCEQTSSIKEDVTCYQAFLDNTVENSVATDIRKDVIEAQKIDEHERTDIDILETKITNDLCKVEEPLEATKVETKKEASINLKYENSDINQQFNIKQASSNIKEEYSESTEQVASFVAKKSKNYVEENLFETQKNVEINTEVFSEAFLGKAGLTSDLNYTKIETKSEEITATKNYEKSVVETNNVESTISAAMAQKRAELQKLTFKDDTKVSRSSSGSSFPSTIDTPTPATVPPTPITDEYMFRLQHQLPKEFPHIENDSEFSPEAEHEDLNIVKKKLIPHIDTAIEQVKYDMPLPSPPAFYKRGSLSGSPQSGSRRSSKDDIKEIERRSSLLASAIDQTIKNIEQYKEQVSIETKRGSYDGSATENGIKSPIRKPSIERNPKRVSISETPQIINVETVTKPESSEESQTMYECVVDEAKTIVFDTKEKIQMAQEWAKVIGELKINGKSSEDCLDETVAQSKPIEQMQPDVTLIESTKKVSDDTKTASSEKSFQSQSEIIGFQTHQNTTQTEITNSVQSFESTKTSELSQSCQLRRDSVPGFRSVKFIPSVATYDTQSTIETKNRETSKIEITAKQEVIEKSSKVEEITREAEVVESVEINTEPVPGYRPVKFDPEEISKYIHNEDMLRQHSGFRSVQLNGSNVEEVMTSEQKLTKRYMTPDGELLGTQQGIVDGLEEPVIPPDVAKELGKPGMTEDKIAELISGESEMLREAHVMGLSRVIGSHMTRVDENDSRVDFKKIKPTIERLKDSEVIKALNEEVVKEKVQKKEDDRKWTTFLQKPQRPVPKAKFGYHGWTSVEVLPQDQYKVKIVKQPKPKVAPDYIPKDFNTGLLPWEERAANEPPPPPVVPEDPILIPESEVEFYEAVDPMPDSVVPDLEETGIPLPTESELTNEKEDPLPEIAEDTEEQNQEAQEFDLEQAIADTERIVLEDMEKNQLTDQLMMNVQSMVDPNASLEQQLAQMRLQLSALAQLPSVIQQTLELVTKQLSQITQQDASKVDYTVESVENAAITEDPNLENQQQIIQENGLEEKLAETIEEAVTENDVDTLTAMNTEHNEIIQQEVNVSSIEEQKKTVCLKSEQRTIEMQKKDVIDEMQLQIESRQVKNHPTPRSANPKPAFGPLTPQERPLVLPGGRRWRGPKDAYNEQFFTDTLAAQAELIQGKTMGINFMKYEKPPVSLDHLKDSDVYKMVHNMESGPMRRVDYLNKSIAESDYREHCRSMTPCPVRMPREEQHSDIPQQVQP